MNKHTGYKCKYCGKVIETSGGLGGHVNLAHKQQGKMQPAKEQMLRYKNPEEFKRIHHLAMEKREAWRNDIQLTTKQEQLILGGILGDASIAMGNDRSHNARVHFIQGIKQYEYCMWKYEQLKDIVKTKPKIAINRGYGDKIVSFNTMSLPCITEIYNTTKINNITTVTENFLNMIKTPLALAVWVLDDGTLNRSTYVISLGDRTKNEVELLQLWMESKWDIKSTIAYYTKEYVMRFSAKSESLRLKELIEPYVEVDQMKYKILFTT